MVLVSQPKRPQTIHHKRRAGKHHKHTSDYTKPYWPYLPLAIIIGLGVLVNSFWGVVQQAVLSYATNTSISGLVEETNVQRTGGGLASLALNSKLNQAAQAKANDMAARNYWSHNTPEGNPPWTFFSSAGYDYKAAGENLAYGFDSSSTTVVAWMNSPGHRANIMNGAYTEVGFGIANVASYQDAGEQTIVVAMYGAPKVAAAAAPAPTSTQQQKPAPATTPAEAQPTPPAETPVTEQPAPETNEVPEVVVTAEAQNEIAPASQRVARIQLLTDSVAAPWTLFAITALATVAVAAVFLRHSMQWRRTLIKGEKFFLKHRYLDIALVLVGVLGFILTRSAGSIH